MNENNKTKNLNKSKKYVGLFIHIPFYTDNLGYDNSAISNVNSNININTNNSTNNKANESTNESIIKNTNNNSDNSLVLYNNYIKALMQELKNYKEKLSNHIISSIFIGGGATEFNKNNLGLDAENKNGFSEDVFLKNSSVVLSKASDSDRAYKENKTYNNAIKQVLSLVKQLFKLQKGAEITVETNMFFVQTKTSKTWRLCGVNRVSLVLNNTPKKLQKTIFKNSVLTKNGSNFRFLNTCYNKKVFNKAITILKQNSLKNINADLTIGYPHQKAKQTISIIKNITNQNLTHVSLYDFVLKDYNVINNLASKGKIALLPDNKTTALFNKSTKLLQKNGFIRYEISHFSKPNFKSKHALGLWNMQEFVGVGAGAYSFLNNNRYNNFSSINSYIKSINSGSWAIENNRQLSSEELFEDAVMLALQTVAGVDLNKILKQYNINLLKQKQHKINELIKLGYVKLVNNHLVLTKAGFAVYNAIVLELLY